MKKTSKNIRFFKQDLLKSVRYRNKRDMLQALLKDDRAYTFQEVDALINNFLRKEVN